MYDSSFAPFVLRLSSCLLSCEILDVSCSSDNEIDFSFALTSVKLRSTLASPVSEALYLLSRLFVILSIFLS